MFPTLHQIHTRVLLTELGETLQRRATLNDVPDELLDELAQQGVNWLWLLGVWQTGPAGQEKSRTSADWRAGFLEDLPDYTDLDICGSPFAICNYTPHVDFGGAAALARFRERLRSRAIQLMLDFVPNHVAIDHPWVEAHPEYLVQGTNQELRNESQNYIRLGDKVFAHGRDPYFPGWRDTLQLNFRHAGLRQAMIDVLLGLTKVCDGIRCDMAMLLLPNVFKRTWGDRSQPCDGSAAVDTPFWPEAIQAVRARRADFLFLSEVYWDLEAALQAQGFDYTYDKSYYDRLCTGDAEVVRDHLAADDEFQRKCARFLENHDEQRAAAVFEPAMNEAAAVLTYTVPGMRFFHEGQFDGRRKRMNVHLSRKANEFPNPLVRDFYRRLLTCLRRNEFREGRWKLLSHHAAWAENPTWRNFIAYEWRNDDHEKTWVVVNYGRTQGQCYVEPADESLRGQSLLLRDQMSRTWYQRDGYELCDRGLYLDLPAWGYHIFDVTVT